MNKKPAATGTPATEVAALLLEVLRNVDREVKTTLELGDEAQEAVQNFRRIASDLATRPANAFSPAPRAQA